VRKHDRPVSTDEFRRQLELLARMIYGFVLGAELARDALDVAAQCDDVPAPVMADLGSWSARVHRAAEQLHEVSRVVVDVFGEYGAMVESWPVDDPRLAGRGRQRRKRREQKR
jgi:hypothetical protein